MRRTDRRALTEPVKLYECYHCTRRVETAGPPGACVCRTRHPYPWRVLPLGTPPRPAGFVRVISSEGSQELHGPDWREDPKAWRKE